jgi:hypothetical protein
MTQNTVNTGLDYSGADLLDVALDGIQDNFLTNNSGTSRPSYAQVGTFWLDTTTTPWIGKIFNGTDDIIVGTFNATTLIFSPSVLPTLGSADTVVQVNSGGTALEYGKIATANLATDAVTPATTNTAVTAIGSIGGGTQDIDLSGGVRAFSGTVDTGETTFTFSSPKATGNEDIFTLRLTNGGSQTVNWPASVDWSGGTAPTLTVSGVDELVFKTIDGGTIWVGAALLYVK